MSNLNSLLMGFGLGGAFVYLTRCFEDILRNRNEQRQVWDATDCGCPTTCPDCEDVDQIKAAEA